jgi:hypothetical protein
MKLRHAAPVHPSHGTPVTRAGPVGPPDDVDLAIRRVLDAEAAAEARVRAALDVAEGVRDAARADARSIAARAQRRIVAMRHRFEERTRRDVERIEADAPAATTHALVDDALVARIVASVAADLTGAATGPPAASEGGTP